MKQPLRRIAWTFWPVAIICLTASFDAQAPAQPTAEAPRTGLIVGQVRDATTGAAVGEAIVQLALQGSSFGRVMADADGRFFFSQLPPGNYFLEAVKEGYTPGRFGQRRPWGQSQPLTLGPGGRLADADLRVWKHAVIGGTVLDEAGEPVVGVTVRALVKEPIGGRQSFGSREVLSDLAPTATTDDRGIFRLPRLTPGTFVIAVPSTHATVPPSALTNIATSVRNELFRAGVHEVSPPGDPRTLNAGELALLTLKRVAIPPAPAPDGRWLVYPTVFHPAARSADMATPITVRAGEERLDLTITLRPVPAVRVSGRLVTPDGTAPPGMALRLVGEALKDVVTATASSGPEYVGFDTATALTDTQGRFTFLGVPSGTYVLTQSNPFLIASARDGGTAYWLSQPVTVGRGDVTDLAVQLRPALRLEGRIESRASGSAGTSPPAVPGIGFETPFGEPGQVFAEIRRDTQTFSTLAAGGRFIVRAFEPRGWVVQSVTLDGKDITDRPFDLQADATTLVITYTDRASRLTGRVTGPDGAPDPQATVLAFPVDRARWTGYGSSPRLLKTALTTRSGSYAFDHLPPGPYYVVAVATAESEGWTEPARLELFATRATRVTIEPGEPQTEDLKREVR